MAASKDSAGLLKEQPDAFALNNGNAAACNFLYPLL